MNSNPRGAVLVRTKPALASKTHVTAVASLPDGVRAQMDQRANQGQDRQTLTLRIELT